MSEAVRTLHEYDTSEQFVARVISNEPITSPGAEAEVRELVLEVQRPDFPYQIGQSIGVIAPGEPGLGEYEHFRLYSVADLPELDADGLPRIKLCVRRCSYLDDITGERHPGVASNFLCDRQPGDRITVTGPFGLVFEVPEEMDANLILIGSGTGIAPFRAFVKHIYRHVPGWQGRIWLLYGAKSGLELLYMNDEKDDFVQYYDEETFEAFKALSPRPSWADPIAWDQAIEARGEELWAMFGDPKTYVYVAGIADSLNDLDSVFARLAGSPQRWQQRKAELKAGRRWLELVY